MTDTTEPTTKNLILDTAERLFGERGFASTSVRTIIKEAGVNTAAIHYHFGSKEDLIHAVIARRAEPVNRERIARLDAIEAAHPQGPLPAEAVIDAFVEPVLSHHRDAGESERFRRLIGRMAMEANLELRGVIQDLFDEVGHRFMRAISRVAPHIDPDELFWRLHFMVGAMCFAISMPTDEKCAGGFAPPNDSPMELRERLVRFLSAGIVAPAPQTTRKDRN